ncbi:hypothetical protein ACWT_3101 [Actinoplanes sp. SE50]|uniref:hypothetical protein n=1 Tax=unclassified Actinoplanes TaxID=2626549 RepID=UPI00023EC44E|nr:MULTISPECIES: hypothetical protein [unclassified Actinoplanes]AEV84124.1 hypothetical protein ACPL_3229 [Actinoplanes sp. SE50/110]ATO82516.1 hypothetical protein ACWT_3101 [Actinoplanes sp. SE50]SLL99923.1 uncharacterized protein ACSP50_3155 [Actinoplanes sp. SE50/110]
MFWREQKAAIAGFHPLHQALIAQRGVAATLPAAGWAAFVTSLQQHAGLIRRRKWALPARTLDVVVPLILELCSDLGPEGTLSVTADLRGLDAPGKCGPEAPLAVRPPIRKATEAWVIDPWLRLRGDLRDGSVLEILVVDRERRRRITKRNPRGKYKTKQKRKLVQTIRVRRRLPKGADSRVPVTPPPGWIGVLVREGERRSVLAAAKLDPVPRSAQEQIDRILSVATEPFRWTSPMGEIR